MGGVGDPVTAVPAVNAEAGVAANHSRHLNTDGTPRYTNELAKEHSPYLLQHAHQPIHWLPWSETALERAKTENRLILLSIGYSTCNGCQVMARESYDDETVAELLNEHYLAIKVDREERPDLDARYMAKLELLTTSAGWPINLILTPDLKVIAGDSYLPKEAFIDLLGRYQQAWRAKPQSVRRLADSIEGRLASVTSERIPEDTAAFYQSALQQLRNSYDRQYHGFGSAPKFPSAHALQLLLDSWYRTAASGDRAMLLDSLAAMLANPVYDAVDGGFFRYSVSADWQRPHFEKMLYDQALLAPILAEAWSLSDDPRFAQAAIRTLDFLRQRLKMPSGLYASAVDASTDGVEGAFYLLRDADLAGALDAAERLEVEKYFRRIAIGPDAFLLAVRKESGEAPTALSTKLRQLRNLRPHPFVDTKAITAWNAMVVSALVQCGRLLGKPELVAEGEATMRVLLAQNFAAGVPYRYSRGSGGYGPLSLEDVAYVLAAFADLHAVTDDPYWFEEAGRLATRVGTTGLLSAVPQEALRDAYIPAPAGVLLDASDRLAGRAENDVFKRLTRDLLQELRRGAVDGSVRVLSLARALRQTAVPPPRRRAYLADGHIKAEFVELRGSPDRVMFGLQLDIDPGWHINGPTLGDGRTIPTTVTGVGWQLGELRFPEARPDVGSVGFDTYDARVLIRGVLRPMEGNTQYSTPKIAIRLQACGQNVCFTPEVAEIFGGPISAEATSE